MACSKPLTKTPPADSFRWEDILLDEEYDDLYRDCLPYFPSGIFLISRQTSNSNKYFIYTNRYGTVYRCEFTLTGRKITTKPANKPHKEYDDIHDYISKHKCLVHYVDKRSILVANKLLNNCQRNYDTDDESVNKEESSTDVVPFIPLWFHGYLDAESANEVLCEERVGSYLVRRSKRTDYFVLSVRHQETSPTVRHIEIKPNGEDELLYSNKRFGSVVQLIRYLVDSSSIIYPVFVKKKASDIVIPREIKKMNPVYYELYLKALLQGKEKQRSLRLMIVGHVGVGKTSLAMNLMQKPLSEIQNTNGIDVHERVVTEAGQWKEKYMEIDDTFKRIAVVSRLSLTEEGNKEMIMQPTFKKAVPTESDDVMPDDSEKYEVATENHRPTSIINMHSKQQKSPIISEGSEEHVRKFVSALEDDETYETVDGMKKVSIWDFGGQYVFYATHQLFHSPKAVYLLVLDASKHLETTVIDDDSPNIAHQLRSIESFCKFWMFSIHSFVGNANGQPPVILVGTHKDMMQESHQTNAGDTLFDQIRDMFSGTPVLNHIQPDTFLINNFETKSNSINHLRKYIEDVALKYRNQNEDMPAKWILLENMLTNRRKECKHISFEEVCRFNAKSDCPIENVEEIKLFLHFHHIQGTLLYFEDEGLSTFVVLNPQWIIDAFKCIITSKRFCKARPEFRGLWNELSNKAILRPELVDEIWRNDQDSDFFQNKSVLLEFLTKLRIIARMHRVCEETPNVDTQDYDHFLVPSLLSSHSNAHEVEDLLAGTSCTFTLVFKFNSDFVSPTLYHRITAAALGRWRVVKYVGKDMLHENIGIYELDDCHIGLIQKTDSTIDLRVASHSETKINIQHSDRMRRFVEFVLKHELNEFQYERERQYKYGIKCNKREAYKDSATIIYIDDLKEKKHGMCWDCVKPHTIESDAILKEWFPVNNKDDSVGIKDRIPTEREISQISQAIGFNWELLGPHLGVSRVVVQQIKMNFPNAASVQIYHMLNKWVEKQNKEATLQYLFQILDDNRKVSVDWDLIKNMSDSFS